MKQVCNSETKSQCRSLLGELNKSFSQFDQSASKFEKEIFKYKDMWLPYKFSSTYTAGLHSYAKLATIKKIFDSELGATEPGHLKVKDFDPSSDSIFTLVSKTEELEKLNETFFFKFREQDESVKAAINDSAIYMSIKKAFTPYAVLHMLRQLQLAYKLQDNLSVEEKYPLLFYIVTLELKGQKVSHILKS